MKHVIVRYKVKPDRAAENDLNPWLRAEGLVASANGTMRRM